MPISTSSPNEIGARKSISIRATMMPRSAIPVAAPSSIRKAARADSMYVRKTALLTWPMTSTSRKRTVSRCTKSNPSTRRMLTAQAELVAVGVDRVRSRADLGRLFAVLAGLLRVLLRDLLALLRAAAAVVRLLAQLLRLLALLDD